MKLGEFSRQKHIAKDDKAEWCKEKGHRIENSAGDGNCLYASLGRSINATSNKVRQILYNKSETRWTEHMKFDIDGSAYNKFRGRTIDKKEWG
eukprot:12390868-Heterocapsa_arctica.AAC.1